MTTAHPPPPAREQCVVAKSLGCMFDGRSLRELTVWGPTDGRSLSTTTLSPDLRDLFQAPNIAHVATLLDDRSPHTVPVWVGAEDGQVAVLASPIDTMSPTTVSHLLISRGAEHAARG
jgi:hypothetical protein